MSDKRSPRKFHSHEASITTCAKEANLDYLKTLVPNQYVTYEIFDLAFKQMWSVVNKLEIQQMKCCHNDKIHELEKRILNLEDIIHKLGTINNTIPDNIQKQVIEINEASKNTNYIINTQLNEIKEYYNSRILSVEEACTVLTRVVDDIQNEYESLKDQIDKMDTDLMNLFKQFQSILKLENTTNHLEKEYHEIQKTINEIYQFI